jgi:uncharacterized protein
MSLSVEFEFEGLHVKGQLNDSATAEIIYAALPIDSKVNTWGDEIYFEIPAKLSYENATLDLEAGDIGYWPQGACLCLFFGRTPASIDDKPRPASEVNLVGSFSASVDELRKIRAGSRVRIFRPSEQ